MKIVRVELTRVEVPFKRAFSHAAAVRSVSDAIIILVECESGQRGFGEIQARPYVTGETNDEIWTNGAPTVCRSLVGASLESAEDVVNVLGGISAFNRQPALIGGFDLALHDLLIVAGLTSWDHLFGPRRSSATERCLTIGGDYTGSELKKQAMIARLGNYSVVKLKVSRPDDAERVLDLRRFLGPSCRIRLDANGELSEQSAGTLLDACRQAEVESIEEPLSRELPGQVEALGRLYRRTGVPQVADESVCTVVDLEKYAGSGAYQVINVRVGKCGGVSGTRALIGACERDGFSMVCGTMVGESAVMLNVSKMLLEHCDKLTYIEGIDQAGKLLTDQVIVRSETEDRHFSWLDSALEKHVVARQEFG